MQELTTDLWSILLPEEWEAEQEDETIMIVDVDEVSIIELTPLMPENTETVQSFIKDLITKDAKKTTLAGLPAFYQELVEDEDDMFWREWYCDAGTFVLAVSHGTDMSNKNMDDGSVDDILSTLLLNEE
jgi:hypothetical protein